MHDFRILPVLLFLAAAPGASAVPPSDLVRDVEPLLESGDYAAAEARLREDFFSEAERLMLLGRLELCRNNAPLAAVYFDSLTALPDPPPERLAAALLGAARIYAAAGRPVDVLNRCDTAAQRLPADPAVQTPFRFLRAEALSASGREGEALALYDTLHRDGTVTLRAKILAGFGAGMCLRRQGRTDDAETRFRTLFLTESYPASDRARAGVEVIRLLLLKQAQDQPESRKFVQEFLSNAEFPPEIRKEALCEFAAFYARKSKWDRARSELNRAMQLAKLPRRDHYGVKMQIVRLLEQQKKPDEAVKFCEQVINEWGAAPRFKIDFLVYLADRDKNAGNFEQARETLRRGYRLRGLKTSDRGRLDLLIRACAPESSPGMGTPLK